MATAIKRLNHYNPLNTGWFLIIAVAAMLPALLFSSFMPAWAPIAALLGLTLLFLLRGLTADRLIHTPVGWPLLLLGLMLLIGLWVTPYWSITLPRTYAFAANLALFWAIAAQRNTKELQWSDWILLLVATILGVVVLLGTRFHETKLPFIDRSIYAMLPSRWVTFWDQESFNPNMSGGLLALFWMPAVMLAWQGSSWQQRYTARLIVIALSIILLLTQSRGALLSIMVAFLTVTPFQNRRWLLLWVIALIVGAVGVYYLGPERLGEMIVGQSEVLGIRSFRVRVELWQRAISVMQDFPLTGVGLGVVEPVIKLLYPTFLISPEKSFNHTHNIYLQAGAEMGWPGLIAYVSLYGILFYALLRQALNRHTGCYRNLALGLFGTLITYLVHGFFDAITTSPQTAFVVWGLFGLMSAVATSSPHQQGVITG